MPTSEELLPLFEAIRNRSVGSRNALLGVFPALPIDDARVEVARHIKATASSSYLSLIHLHENLEDLRWWRRQGFGAAVDSGSVSDELNDYMTLVTVSMIVQPFSLFEAGIRRVVRAIDPLAGAGGTADFKRIYDLLLARLSKSGWSYGPGEPTELLDIYRNIRNTIHNNGRFYSRTGAGIHVVWRGRTYDFVHAQIPPFVDWDFNLLLLNELISLNESIMTSALVAGLPAIP